MPLREKAAFDRLKEFTASGPIVKAEFGSSEESVTGTVQGVLSSEGDMFKVLGTGMIKFNMIHASSCAFYEELSKVPESSTANEIQKAIGLRFAEIMFQDGMHVYLYLS